MSDKSTLLSTVLQTVEPPELATMTPVQILEAYQLKPRAEFIHSLWRVAKAMTQPIDTSIRKWIRTDVLREILSLNNMHYKGCLALARAMKADDPPVIIRPTKKNQEQLISTLIITGPLNPDTWLEVLRFEAATGRQPFQNPRKWSRADKCSYVANKAENPSAALLLELACFLSDLSEQELKCELLGRSIRASNAARDRNPSAHLLLGSFLQHTDSVYALYPGTPSPNVTKLELLSKALEQIDPSEETLLNSVLELLLRSFSSKGTHEDDSVKLELFTSASNRFKTNCLALSGMALFLFRANPTKTALVPELLKQHIQASALCTDSSAFPYAHRLIMQAELHQAKTWGALEDTIGKINYSRSRLFVEAILREIAVALDYLAAMLDRKLFSSALGFDLDRKLLLSPSFRRQVALVKFLLFGLTEAGIERATYLSRKGSCLARFIYREKILPSKFSRTLNFSCITSARKKRAFFEELRFLPEAPDARLVHHLDLSGHAVNSKLVMKVLYHLAQNRLEISQLTLNGSMANSIEAVTPLVDFIKANKTQIQRLTMNNSSMSLEVLVHIVTATAFTRSNRMLIVKGNPQLNGVGNTLLLKDLCSSSLFSQIIIEDEATKLPVVEGFNQNHKFTDKSRFSTRPEALKVNFAFHNFVEPLNLVQAFKCVMQLDLSNNNLKSLDALCELPYLTDLIASHNKVSTLPANMWVWKFLHRFVVNGNCLTTEGIASLTDLLALQHLDLSGNENIDSLPVGLRPIETLHVLGTGIKLKNMTINQYLEAKNRRQREGKLYLTRLILVGNELCRQAIQELLSSGIKLNRSTDTRAANNFEAQCEHSSREEVITFQGFSIEDSLTATHSVLGTDRSVYIVAFDATTWNGKEFTDNKVIPGLYHWLRELLRTVTHARILLVGFLDTSKMNTAEVTALTTYVNTRCMAVTPTKYKVTFVCRKYSDVAMCDALVEKALSSDASAVPDEYRLAVAVIQARKAKLPVLRRRQFQRMLEGVTGMLSPADFSEMTRSFTDIGVCSYFEHLDLVVLDEVWLTDTMNALLKAIQPNENAILSRSQLCDALHKVSAHDDFPQIKTRFDDFSASNPIVQILEMCLLLHPLKRSGRPVRWFVPSLLAKQPSEAFQAAVKPFELLQVPRKHRFLLRKFTFNSYDVTIFPLIVLRLIQLAEEEKGKFWNWSNGLVLHGPPIKITGKFKYHESIFLDWDSDEDHPEQVQLFLNALLPEVSTIYYDFFSRVTNSISQLLDTYFRRVQVNYWLGCTKCFELAPRPKDGHHPTRNTVWTYIKREVAIERILKGETTVPCPSKKHKAKLCTIAFDYLMLNAPRITEIELIGKEPLGEGGFGQVVEATATLPGGSRASVAIKASLDSPDLDTMIKRRLLFIRECTMLQRERHPSLVVQHGIAENPLRSVQALYKSLPEVLKEYPLLDSDAKARLILDIARGVRFLHDRLVPILHGDLHVANILVGVQQAAEDSKVLLKFSAVVADPGCATEVVQPISIHRSNFWCAPETMLDPYYTEKADTYSMGVLIWQVFIPDLPPFPSHLPIFTLAKAVAHENLRPQWPKHCRVPQFLRKMAEECWATDPALRPSFRQIVRRLEEKLKVRVSKSRSDDVPAARERGASIEYSRALPPPPSAAAASAVQAPMNDEEDDQQSKRKRGKSASKDHPVPALAGLPSPLPNVPTQDGDNGGQDPNARPGNPVLKKLRHLPPPSGGLFDGLAQNGGGQAKPFASAASATNATSDFPSTPREWTGTMSLSQFEAACRADRVAAQLDLSAIHRAFVSLSPNAQGEVSFAAFLAWLRQLEE